MSARSSDQGCGKADGSGFDPAAAVRAGTSSPRANPPNHGLRTRLTLRPGGNGTKKLVRRHGARLIVVRSRYDVAAQRRFKTVELLKEELPWNGGSATRRAPLALGVK